MILEAVLYFVLGFLSAALLALMVAPAIWNRAVVLTKKRIESSVPLTLNEIQADKDQLRAEFAMSTRRLEMSVEELKNKASNQLIEINRRRDEVNKLDQINKERLSEFKKLELRSQEVAQGLDTREKKLSSLIEQHESLQAEHKILLEEVHTLRSTSSDTQQALKTAEIELTASNATVEALKGTVSTFDMSEDDKTKRVSKLLDEKRVLNDKLAASKQEIKQAREKAKAIETELKSAKKNFEKQLKTLQKASRSNADVDTSISELTSQLIDEKAKSVELEAKLAKYALQTEALLNDASNENVEAIVATLRDEIDEKSSAMRNLRNANDKMKLELDAFKNSADQDWTDERQEKAYMRERINDLAAQVAAMTANLEGKGSTINKILAETDAKAAETDITNGKTTLADRIKAIQTVVENR